jgi:hypothetical protein
MLIQRPDPTTDPRPVSASKAHGGSRADSCPTCGATTKRRWCPAHDPDKAGRNRAHAERVALYRQKAGLA